MAASVSRRARRTARASPRDRPHSLNATRTGAHEASEAVERAMRDELTSSRNPSPHLRLRGPPNQHLARSNPTIDELRQCRGCRLRQLLLGREVPASRAPRACSLLRGGPGRRLRGSARRARLPGRPRGSAAEGCGGCAGRVRPSARARAGERGAEHVGRLIRSGDCASVERIMRATLMFLVCSVTLLGASVPAAAARPVAPCGSRPLSAPRGTTTLLERPDVTSSSRLAETMSSVDCGVATRFAAVGATTALTLDLATTLYWRVREATVFAAPARDVLKGDEDDDVIRCGPGSDEFRDGAGNDVVHGGDGNDTMFLGGSGDDTFFMDDGNDHIDDGLGSDTYMGGGGEGDFVLYFGGGNVFDGGPGRDEVGVLDNPEPVVIDLTTGASTAKPSWTAKRRAGARAARTP